MRINDLKTTTEQLTLDLEPGLVARYTDLLDVVAQGVYQRGLKVVAIEIDKAPSNLSAELGRAANRHFSVDSLEAYIEKTGDVTPIRYLVQKFMRSHGASDEKKLDTLRNQMAEMQKLLSSMQGGKQ